MKENEGNEINLLDEKSEQCLFNLKKNLKKKEDININEEKKQILDPFDY